MMRYERGTLILDNIPEEVLINRDERLIQYQNCRQATIQ
ncbi:unnamed protein product, partial [Didymodactylos carnosus]